MRQEWAQTAKALRVLCVALIFLGSALLCLGVVGDALGWWTSLSFTTNVLSGVTSASFGVPIAVLLIRSLVGRTDSKAEDAKVRTLVAAQAKRTSDASKHFHQVDVPTNLEGNFASIDLGLERIEQLARLVDPAVEGAGLWRAGGRELVMDFESRRRVRERLKDEVRAIGVANGAVYRTCLLSDDLDFAKTWASMRDEWHFFSSAIRMRALEVGMPWLSFTAQAQLGNILSRPVCFAVDLQLYHEAIGVYLHAVGLRVLDDEFPNFGDFQIRKRNLFAPRSFIEDSLPRQIDLDQMRNDWLLLQSGLAGLREFGVRSAKA